MRIAVVGAGKMGLPMARHLAAAGHAVVDWRQMWDVIGASAVGAPIVKAKAEQLRERDYTPTFTVDQMKKDVGLILQAGAQLDVPMALTAVVALAAVAAGRVGRAAAGRLISSTR